VSYGAIEATVSQANKTAKLGVKQINGTIRRHVKVSWPSPW